jgi:hypothetical protein
VCSQPASSSRSSIRIRGAALGLPPRQIRCDLREVLEPRRAFAQVTLEPTHRRPLVLRRSTLGVEVDERERLFERQVRELAGSVLSSPEGPPLDGSAEANLWMRFRRHRTYVPMPSYVEYAPAWRAFAVMWDHSATRAQIA